MTWNPFTPVLRAITIVALSLLTGLSLATPAAKIRVGDVLTIHVEHIAQPNGDFAVQSDGSIYAPIIERLEVAGKSIEQIKPLIAQRLRKRLRNPDFSVTLFQQRNRSVAVYGSKTGGLSEVALLPGVDLRTVAARAGLDGPADDFDLIVYRSGKAIQTVALQSLLNGSSGVWAGPLEADDVVVVQPKQSVRVWVLGNVKAPGMRRVEQGDTVERAIANSGGILAPDGLRRSDLTVVLRRGADVFTGGSVLAKVVQPGDTIDITAPKQIKISVLGQVVAPGELELREGASLGDVVAAAKGPLVTAQISQVMVFRQDKVLTVPLSIEKGTAQNIANFRVQDGDLVYVPENQARSYVLGFVNRPGKIVLEETKSYRLSDVLGLAGGMQNGAATNRIVYARLTSTGEVKSTIINFDEFLREGKLASNPVVTDGDIFVIQSAQETVIGQLSRVISSGILINNIFKK